jgi:hypothetical protein
LLELEQSEIREAQLRSIDEERKRKHAEKKRIEQARLQRDKAKREERLRKLKEASPDTIRTLRELVRSKYELDVEIWGLRSARKPDHWIVEQKMEKADAIMYEIWHIIAMWDDNSDGAWDEEEWRRVSELRKRLGEPGNAPGIKIWAQEPLWVKGR